MMRRLCSATRGTLELVAILFSMVSGLNAEGGELLSVNMSDPAIRDFLDHRGRSISLMSSPELRTAVAGLKIPILDFTQQPSLSANGVRSSEQPKLSFSADDDQKLWYSITREYKQRGVSITISGNLRVQARVESTSRPKPLPIEIIPASKTVSKDEDFISAQINLYRFPNIPYVIDIECNPEARAFCTNRELLSKIPEKIGLIAVP